jgi:hypothetical protein
MSDLNRYFNLWKNVLQKPEAVFKSEIKRASLEDFAKNLVIAGLIVGLISGIAGAIGISQTMFGALGSMTVFIASIVLWPILLVISSLISSAIYYIFAKLLGGKGSFTQQAYLISLYTAPLTILLLIVNLIPVIGFVVDILIGVYSLYLLTLVLKQVHKFTTGKAILTWLLPLIIILLLVMILVMTFAAFFLPFTGVTTV